MKLSPYERVIRRLLREAEESELLGAYVYEDAPRRVAILYDINQTKEYLTKLASRGEPPTWQEKIDLVRVLTSEVIKGIIKIAPSDKGNCWGAWEVQVAAAPNSGKHAKLTYALGYAMSDSGRLMSDRSTVSIDAKNAWRRIFQGDKRTALRLDDVNHMHWAPGNEYHTDTSRDDCRLYWGKSGNTSPESNLHLQHAYESLPTDATIMRLLSTQHENFIAGLGDLGEFFMSALSTAGREFFIDSYPGPAGD